MAIQRTILDMTGRDGLAKKWGGDIARSGFEGSQQIGQPNLRYEAGDKQTVFGVYNAYSKYGFMSPAGDTFITTSVDTDEEFTVSIVDDVNNSIWISNQDKLFYSEFDMGGFSEIADYSVAATIATDMAIYYINGVRTGFVAMRTSTRSQIKTFTLTGSIVINEDWATNDVTGAFDLYQSYATKLIPSGDGFMYVLNKNAVHRIDGTVIGGANGKIYKDILLAPTETNLTHGVEFKNKLYIVVQTGDDDWRGTTGDYDLGTSSSPSGQVGVYVWNRQSTFYNSSDFVELPGVSHVRNIWVTPKNDLYIMAILPTGETQLMVFNGSKFVVAHSMPPGGTTNFPDALTTYGNFSIWAGADGYIYSLGSEYSDEKDALTIIGQYNRGGYGEVGPVVITAHSINSNNYFVEPNTRNTTDVISIVGEYETNQILSKQFLPFGINSISQ